MQPNQLLPAAVFLLQWRANRYPGCACDVTSVMYSYSFEPYPWTQLYSEQKEILQYLHHCAGEYVEHVCTHTHSR
jgi:cation diffusion facilitator CzcD-associated flavoprotein CzcO